MEWGLFGDASKETETKHTTLLNRFKNSDELLRLIADVTGASTTDLKTVYRGPGANPARRFAVTALVKHTQPRQREIGTILNMSVSQVSNVIHRTNLLVEPFPQ